MATQWKLMQRIGLGILVIALAVVGFRVLVATKPVNQKKSKTFQATPVEVVTLEKKDHAITIVAHGSVLPAVEIKLRPEVAGRVVSIHSQLVTGGRLQKGEVLLRIDPSDYELDLASKKAQVTQAQAALHQELGRQKVAEVEWQLYRKAQNDKAEPSALALRKPQLLAAQAKLESSKIALQQAELTLKRCTLRAPFNALVLAEAVDSGQWISNQTPLATLVDSDRFWVELSVPPEQIRFVQFADLKLKGQSVGSKAIITTGSSDKNLRWEGRVERLLGSLDPIGRLARLVVSVENPLGEHPLLLGSYVTIQIQGKTLTDVIEVPRQALYQGDKLLIAQPNDSLGIHKAEVIWRTRDSVLVRQDNLAGKLLVTSPLSRPVSGMKIQLTNKRTAQSQITPKGKATQSGLVQTIPSMSTQPEAQRHDSSKHTS